MEITDLSSNPPAHVDSLKTPDVVVSEGTQSSKWRTSAVMGNSFESSPEDLAITAILARFDENKYGFPCHTLQDRQRLISTLALNKNIYVVDALAKMEQAGTEPTFIGFEDNNLVFVELAEKMPESRRSINYDNSLEMAQSLRSKLINKTRYLELSNKYRIRMDQDGDCVWINSEHEPEDLRWSGYALSADQLDNIPTIDRRRLEWDYPDCAFRCEMKVKIA